MKTFRKNMLIGVALTVFCLFGMVSNSAALSLPDPTLEYDGKYIAWAHDDFWSFYAPFIGSFTAGTGQNDVILYTKPTVPYNLGFEDPVQTSAGVNDTVDYGIWGAGVQDGGPVTVSQVLAFLNSDGYQSNIPVFMLDLNQNNDAPIGFVGRVFLTDNLDTLSVYGDALWAFDINPQGGGDSGDNRDPNNIGYYDPILAPDFDYPGFGANGDFDLDAPATALFLTGGGGKVDYIAYAPMMDLSKYPNTLYFVTEFWLGDLAGAPYPLNNGAEEIYLTRRFGTDGTQVPEPSTMLLLGFGLVGLAAMRRKFGK